MRCIFQMLILIGVCPLAATAQEPIERPLATRPQSASDLGTPQVYLKEAQERWAKDIAAFDALNENERHSPQAVLFIGSSSIRRWATISTDMAPFETIRRGYGGAKFTDMAVFAEQIITPHQFKAIVMFVGNGVVGKPEDHTPEQIEALTRHIVAVSHKHQPHTPFFLIEITPCESRYGAWPKIRAVNARLREVALSTPDTYFIPTASHYLKADSTPRPELFVKDKLHLNQAGYELWASLIRTRLNDVLRARAVESNPAAGHAEVAK